MSRELWTAVDRYITDFEETLRANSAAGLPPHDVTPNQGKLLHLLARVQGAKRILEIGTLGGYSTIWLARALPPDGTIVTLEADPKHAEVALANVARSSLRCVVDLRVGPALQSISELHQEGASAFDLIFIDADKPNNPAYLEWALRLSRPGTIIIADNVVRDGTILNAGNSDPSVRGVRRFFEALAAEPRLDATAIQTVGNKGYDGFVLAVVTH